MTEKWRVTFGILGNITTVLSSLAPIPTFYRIYKRRNTESFSPLPYATTILCNLFWAWYALPFITQQNLLLLVISAIQVALQSIYLTMFLMYSPPDRKGKTTTLVFAILILFALDMVITLAFLRNNQHKRRTFAGVVATISSILAYAAPLSIMGLVIRTKSVEYMPFLLSLAIFFSGFTWTVYGILGPDVFVIISDGLGFLLSTLQLILYAAYYKPQVPYNSVISDEPDNMLELTERSEQSSTSSTNYSKTNSTSDASPPHQTSAAVSVTAAVKSQIQALKYPQPIVVAERVAMYETSSVVMN